MMAKQTSPDPRVGSDVKEEVQEQSLEQAMPIKDSANPTTDNVSPLAESHTGSSTPTSANGATTSTEVYKTAPESRKRALPEPSTDSEPSTKKSRDSPSPSLPETGLPTPPTFPSPPDMPATTFDKQTWQGFCDIESEPACFSVILREMGVRGITVREVFSMDQDFIMSNIPQPIYGFILLFHYREFGNDDQAEECPKDVWFANQLPAQNSCATLAMINILMNLSSSKDVEDGVGVGVGVGEHLEQFKEFTDGFTPYQRGEALASFDFVKRIHNSFAKKMDILEGDKHLSYKVKKAERIKMQLAEKTKFKGKGTKSRQPRRDSAESVATNDSEESVEDNAHHYIAFVPIGNEVWKLDGLDKQPTHMGSFAPEKGETWLDSVSSTIETLMAAGDDDYGVIALAQSPLLSLRKKASLTINTLTHVEARLDSTSQDWKKFISEDEQPPSPRMLGLEEHLPANPVPASLKAKVDSEGMPDLIDRRKRLVSEANGLAVNIMMEMQNEADEDEKATQRRYDSGPVIKKWLEMLAENGFLEENLERHMPGKGKGKK
jgi:ubiquitin carboxyl-terminal hydrolase L5